MQCCPLDLLELVRLGLGEEEALSSSRVMQIKLCDVVKLWTLFLGVQPHAMVFDAGLNSKPSEIEVVQFLQYLQSLVGGSRSCTPCCTSARSVESTRLRQEKCA